MRLVLMGPPGAGKGTQAIFLCKQFSLMPISTGDLLREEIKAGTVLGRQVQSELNHGALVSDDTILSLVLKQLGLKTALKGYLFDGFPRTLYQAESLNALTALDFVVDMVIPDQMILERMSGRMIHPSSGRVYHVSYNPPQVHGRDDITGEPLVLREDDKPAVVKKRLEIYQNQSRPICDFYQRWFQSDPEAAPVYLAVDATGSVHEVRSRIVNALRSAPKKAAAPHECLRGAN